MESLRQDLRYATRMLASNRGFTIVAVLSLALGIGANTTIFTLIDGLLLRPPAVEEPSALLEVWQHNTARGNGIGSHMQLSFPDYEYYRDHNRVFTGMAAFTAEPSPVMWNRAGEGETIRGALVSANFFSLLGVRPPVGRAFLPQEDEPATAAPVVVLSDALWKQRLGADPTVIGQTLTLNGRDFTVVGIAPPRFTGLLAGFTPDFWTPVAMHTALSPGLDLAERHQHWILAVGRLRPGIMPAQAKADLSVLGQQLAADFPEPDRNLAPAVVPVDLVPSPFRGFIGGISGVLMAVVGLVLLIACANVANLLLAKASTQRREVAIRAALGATRRRLLQQMLTESVLIALVAGTLGLVVSFWAAPLLVSLRPASLPLAVSVSPDLRVLAFTLVASVVTGIAFGLAPALQQSRRHHVTDLKEGSSQGGSAKSRLRHGLVIAQVTACVVLLAGASLCVRSLLNARSIDPGFDTRHAVAASIDVATFGYDEARGKTYHSRLLEHVRALPGVRSAGLADHLPLSQMIRMEGIGIDGYEGPAGRSGTPEMAIDMAIVGPGYFDAMGIPLLRGRTFAATDNESAPTVVVINQEMADRFWPHQDPVGRFVTVFAPRKTRVRAEIVGVVKTGKYQTLGEEAKPFFYRSLLQDYQPAVRLVVRTNGDVAIAGALRDEVRNLDPRMALADVETLEQHMQLPLFPARAAGLLLGTFGLLALGLAVVGLFGVTSYSVSQRTREIGVRMALGARPDDVLRLVLGQALRLTLIGVLIGLAGALGVTRVLSSLLYGISATDPISFGTVALVLTVVALLASYVPARWATRVDPMRALRAE